ncbi:hypothetical protein AJ79_08020 [Helicocarpus griseus UAMH5409]|uniref:HNH nuclease domain-containing protein n=1 Tax=Helicocarpus griseus UAMH5409 TaxID=1447875 RepID=A0A2B7WX37_9EURO|nr:hypothetical protein AJ79_08020 [Helicocarpus griseus UAMH5409]
MGQGALAFFWLSDIEMLKERLQTIRASRQMGQDQVELMIKDAAVSKKRLQLDNAHGSLPSTFCSAKGSSSKASPTRQETLATPSRKRKRTDSKESSAKGSSSSASLSGQQILANLRTPPGKKIIGSSGLPQSSPDKRSRTAKGLCLQRDDKKCVITQAKSPVDGAHIFPFALRNHQTRDEYRYIGPPWNVLKLFWTESRVRAWHNAITGPSGTEMVENLLCFAPHVHAYHGRAFFALQPLRISDDRKSMTLVFHWMPHIQNLSRKAKLLEVPEIPHGLKMHGSSDRSVKLWNVQTERKICSGDRIELRAEPGHLTTAVMGALRHAVGSSEVGHTGGCNGSGG